MKLTTELLHETTLFIKEYYDAGFSPGYSFHNYNRAVNLARTCVTLGMQLGVGKEELKTLHLAAWFLETGVCKDYHNYQTASVALANNYLKEKSVDEEIIRTIEEIILSTRMPQQPLTLLEQVICDGSMYHLAEKSLSRHFENLRMEYKAVGQKEYSDKDWQEKNLSTINDHFYYTPVARDLFEKKKKKQKALLENQPGDLQTSREEKNDPAPSTGKNERAFEPFLEDIKLERGVETFFRITERRHIELSAKAHDKASLLISINSIIISIVLSVLVTKLEENKFLLFPTLLLVITGVTTIILSIISTRPRILKKNAAKEHAENHEFNILFFGDFSTLSLAEYKKAMKETYKDKNELYDSLSRDIYYQGIILVQKYKYIGIAYNVFMYGFVITILSFMVAFLVKIS